MGNGKKLTVGIARGTKADRGVCINGHAFVAGGKFQQIAADVCQSRSPRQLPNLFGRLAIVLRDGLLRVSHGRPETDFRARPGKHPYLQIVPLRNLVVIYIIFNAFR
jgi:hypothetical protein